MMVRIDNRQIRFQNGFAGGAAGQASLQNVGAYFARFSAPSAAINRVAQTPAL
jgi:hypothetical protein